MNHLASIIVFRAFLLLTLKTAWPFLHKGVTTKICLLRGVFIGSDTWKVIWPYDAHSEYAQTRSKVWSIYLGHNFSSGQSSFGKAITFSKATQKFCTLGLGWLKNGEAGSRGVKSGAQCQPLFILSRSTFEGYPGRAWCLNDASSEGCLK